jgi:hypothetical protein
MMVVIPGPVEFLMGSPTTEVGRQDYEIQHKNALVELCSRCEARNDGADFGDEKNYFGDWPWNMKANRKGSIPNLL